MIIVWERMADRVSSIPAMVMSCSLRVILEPAVKSYLDARKAPITAWLEFAWGQLPFGFSCAEPTNTE